MTVDIATRNAPVLVPPPQRQMTFPEKVKYADFLAASDLLPAQYRRKPANVLWAMEYGDAVGLATVVAINGVHVIEGKPSPAASTASALVRSKGHKLRVWYERTAEGCEFGRAVAELVRRDDPDFTFRATWSVEDSVRAEICQVRDGQIVHRTRQGNAGNWQKFPVQMMKARVLGEVCRDGAQDVLLGLVYLAEEHPDVELDEAGQVVSAEWDAPPTRDFPGPVRTSDLTTPPAEARPLAEHAVAATDLPATMTEPANYADDEFTEPPQPLTRRTSNALFALFGEAGLGGRDEETRAERIRVSEILSGREGLTSSSDLSEDDGRVIEDALRAQGDQIAPYVQQLLADDGAAEGES
jgi:hypothetical protein